MLYNMFFYPFPLAHVVKGPTFAVSKMKQIKDNKIVKRRITTMKQMKRKFMRLLEEALISIGENEEKARGLLR